MKKKLLAAAVGSAIAAPMTAQAIDFKVSGHVNRMIRFADNGAGSDINQMDNTASRSRVRFTGSQEIGQGITAGVRLEYGLSSNGSGGIDPKGRDTEDEPSRSGSLRHSALFFSGNFGKVTMGHTSGANDGTTFADNSGTGLAAEFARGEHCSGCAWTFDDGADTSVGVDLGSTSGTFDGGRRDVLRYDTPSLGGVATIAASVGNDEQWAIGAFLDTEVAGGQLSINAGYEKDNNAITGPQGANTAKRERLGISASYLFSQGTNITLAYGTDDPRGPNDFGDDQAYYVKVGHKWGNNAVSIDYGHNDVADASVGASATSAAVTTDVETDSIGLGFVHTIPKVGVNAYAGYHYNWGEADNVGGVNVPDFNDIHLFVVGARVLFN